MLKLSMLRALIEKPFIHLILIAALGLVVYSNTFNVPFQWDEGITIVENPIVKDSGYFANPQKARGFGQNYINLKDRYVGYLTFALNYRINGLDVRGYHVVNVLLHILNAFLVYFFVRLTFMTPFMRGAVKHRNYIALFASLLFVSHPIQTEAVTYIMGRLPLLVGFFYLSSIVLYAKWRLGSAVNYSVIPAKAGIQGLKELDSPKSSMPSDSFGGPGNDKKIIFYLLSLLSVVLAMKTKENAFTLPLAIALYEFFFFKRTDYKLKYSSFPGLTGESRNSGTGFPLTTCGNDNTDYSLKRRLFYLLPFALTLFIIPLTRMGATGALSGEYSATRHATSVSHLSYFFTQLKVVVTYIRLLFLPINQNFAYAQPIYDSFFNPNVLPSCIFLCLILGLGIYLYFRAAKRPDLRIISFGIFWFFLALSIESSIFPIGMIMCEYRVYLPSVGAFMAITAVGNVFAGSIKSNGLKAATAYVFILIPIVFSYAAYERNKVWRSEISLWADVVRKSPDMAIGHNNLGHAFDLAGQADKAMAHYKKAITLDPGYAEAHMNLGLICKSKGFTEEAIEHYATAIKLKPGLAGAYDSLGVLYGTMGRLDEAIRYFQIGVKTNPFAASPHMNLGTAYYKKGLYDMAVNQYEIAVGLQPYNPEAHYNLALAYESTGRDEAAAEHYSTALRSRPNFNEAMDGLARVFSRTGQ